MKKGIIGKKLGMTQIFDEIGNAVPVTVIQAGPCTVVQRKTAEKDGYEAVQLGFEDVKEKCQQAQKAMGRIDILVNIADRDRRAVHSDQGRSRTFREERSRDQEAS